MMVSEAPIPQDTPQDTPYPRRTCEHGEAAFWNPFNQVVQCHRCGWMFIPKPEQESTQEQAPVDVARLQREARESALDEVQEYVGAHEFDTSAGRRIHDFIAERLAALADDEPPLGPEIHPDPRSSFWK